MKKKVMIHAYTKLNLGDDLFIKILCERYPKTMFYLYVPKLYKEVFKDIKNIKIVPSDSLFVRTINFIFRFLKIDINYLRTRTAKKSDATVHIGGSLFMQTENWEKELETRKSMNVNRPYYLLGANFGPYQDNEYYLSYKSIFSTYKDICFRDEYSYNLFKDLPNVRMADDIVFQLKYQPMEQVSNEKNAVISVIKPSIRKHLVDYDEVYYQKLRDIILQLNKNNYRVTLMSFCENEGDEEAVEKIIELLPESSTGLINRHYYKGDIEKALEIIMNSNFVIATRFHSMILGWLFKKPVFPIVYSEKMTNVMNDIGFTGSFTDFNNLHKLEALDVYESIKTNLVDVSDAIKNSEGHFKELDKFLLN